MKKILLPVLAMAALAVGFSACEKDGPKPFKWDNDQLVALNAAVSPQMASMRSGGDVVGDTIFTDTLLTPRQIVEQAYRIEFIVNNTVGFNDGQLASRGFGDLDDGYRDTINNRLLLMGTDIIWSDYETEELSLKTHFIQATDIIIHREIGVNGGFAITDTIAYIPNSVVRTAEAAIKEAYKTKDWEVIQRLFDDAFVFTPITGARYRYLKERGEN